MGLSLQEAASSFLFTCYLPQTSMILQNQSQAGQLAAKRREERRKEIALAIVHYLSPFGTFDMFHAEIR